MPFWGWLLLAWCAVSVPAAVIIGRGVYLAEKEKPVRHPEGTRFERRLRARQEKRRLEELKEMDKDKPKHPLSDPRIGDDRRQRERRAMVMSAEEVDDWLKRNGISSGDRRKGPRRQGERRR